MIDIVSFIPEHAVDPIYYDKAYFLAPDKRGEKTYSLLLAAMRRSERCALAKWAWRAKQYMVQIRPAEGGMVLQQLLYADEVRSLADLDVPLVEVKEPELKLALQLIEQISETAYDPSQFVDEEKERILAAVERKIAGQQVVATEPPAPLGGQVIDLVAALRASLRSGTPKPVPARAGTTAASPAFRGAQAPIARKAARRGARSASAPVATAPIRSREEVARVGLDWHATPPCFSGRWCRCAPNVRVAAAATPSDPATSRPRAGSTSCGGCATASSTIVCRSSPRGVAFDTALAALPALLALLAIGGLAVDPHRIPERLSTWTEALSPER